MILLRSAAFNAAFFGLTTLMVLPGPLVALGGADRALRYAMAWARASLALARWICGIRVEVSGLGNIPPGAALIASRHQSALDTIVWLALAPRCCYVLKRELRRIPLFGPLTAVAGMIAVDRAAGAAAMRALMRDGRRARDEGRQIVIFPEGTRAEPGAPLPLQPGVAALAAATGLPVVPVATDSGLFWGRRAFRKRPGSVRIDIRPPLPAGLPRAELMRRLEAELARPPGAA